jgi:hypothetical protein
MPAKKPTKKLKKAKKMESTKPLSLNFTQIKVTNVPMGGKGVS